MKYKQPCPRFELASQCPFPTTITTALRAPPSLSLSLYIYIYICMYMVTFHLFLVILVIRGIFMFTLAQSRTSQTTSTNLMPLRYKRNNQLSKRRTMKNFERQLLIRGETTELCLNNATVCTFWALILGTVPNIAWPGTKFNTIAWSGTECVSR